MLYRGKPAGMTDGSQCPHRSKLCRRVEPASCLAQGDLRGSQGKSKQVGVNSGLTRGRRQQTDGGRQCGLQQFVGAILKELDHRFARAPIISLPQPAKT